MNKQKSSDGDLDLSFIIPVLNESQSLEQLVDEIAKSASNVHKNYEILFVDDGSSDETPLILKQLRAEKPDIIRIITFRRNFGKSAALSAGFSQAQGNIVVTLDGDLQDDPTSLPLFLDKIEKGSDMVSGWKRRRHDPISKTLPSWVFNKITSKLTGIKLHDFNCGFKAYRREVINSIQVYGELHRFIPVLAYQKGFSVNEVEVNHRQRQFGKSKYGWGRMLVGFLDFLTVLFLSGYVNKPGQFFGRIGLVIFSIGFAIGLYITYLRLTTGTIEYRYPLLFLGGLLVLGGIQLILTGLLAEIVIHSNRRQDQEYSIKEVNRPST